MNNKGFTLMELLVTIILLSIISVISYVSISNVIVANKKNNCITLVDNIKTATSEYISDNRYKKSFVNSVDQDTMSVSITADVLLDNSYLRGPIKNPFDKTDIAGSDIAIDIFLNADYSASSIIVNGIDCEQ